MYELDKQLKNFKTKSRNKNTFEKDYPRIKEIYQIILAGILLFKKVFRIELKTDNVLEILIKSRRIISNELVHKFLEFCHEAREFEQYYGENKSEFVKVQPKYLTCKLQQDIHGNYWFTSKNLRDFNEFTRQNYKLKQLGELLQEAIENKDYITVGTNTFNSGEYRQSMYAIRMDEHFINNWDFRGILKDD